MRAASATHGSLVQHFSRIPLRHTNAEAPVPLPSDARIGRKLILGRSGAGAEPPGVILGRLTAAVAQMQICRLIYRPSAPAWPADEAAPARSKPREWETRRPIGFDGE